MLRATRLVGSAAAVALLVWSTPAWAPYHLAVIEQVFFGTADCPNAQYVMLRTQAPGQILVGTTMQSFRTQTADGSAAADFGQFSENPSNGDSGVAILMGTADAETLFGLTMDQVVDGHLVFADGRVCFGMFNNLPVDCVAYGAYTGDNGAFGSPAPTPQLGMSLARRSNTSDNATDFVLGVAAPRNNAGQIGVLGTCGGAVATATPSATAPAVAACEGDCNDNDVVAVNELITAVNIVLGNQQLSACPAFPDLVEITISNLIRAVNNLLNGCPATPTPTVTPPPTATATVALSTPTATNTPGGPLGVRHFSLNPQTSGFIAVLAPGFTFPNFGFQGFLELTAGVPDPSTGIAFVNVTDASDFLSVNVPAGGLTLCIRIPRDQLPVMQAGIVSCNGGLPLGLDLSQDHNIGVIGACANGAHDGLACAADAQCPGGSCFNAQACTTAGGHLEGDSAPHPGVCNGPLRGMPLSGDDSGPGAVLIAPDPTSGITKGLPVEITMEDAAPCGDESAPGMSVAIALTTGRARCRVLDYNNDAGELSDDRTGQNFSCSAWADENGPGTFGLSAPLLDIQAIGPQATDVISAFVFDD
jgi:hypothetical protein